MGVGMQDAKLAAERLLNETFPDCVGEYVILDERTMTEPFGWVFFYDSRPHLLTGDFSRRPVGNAPIVVTSGGEALFTGTAAPLEEYLAQFRGEEVGS